MAARELPSCVQDGTKLHEGRIIGDMMRGGQTTSLWNASIIRSWIRGSFLEQVPSRRHSSCNVAFEPLSDECVEMLGRQSHPGPNPANISRRDSIACFQISH